MHQGNSGYQYTYIGTVGSVLVTDSMAIVRRVVIPGTYIGTVVLHDSASVAGTTATSMFGTIGLPATGIPTSVDFDLRTKNGLVYIATGTPNVILVWDK